MQEVPVWPEHREQGGQQVTRHALITRMQVSGVMCLVNQACYCRPWSDSSVSPVPWVGLHCMVVGVAGADSQFC